MELAYWCQFPRRVHLCCFQVLQSTLWIIFMTVVKQFFIADVRLTHSVSDFSISNSVRRNSLQRQSTYKSKSSITVSVSDSDTDRPLQSDFIAQLRQVKIQSRIHSPPALPLPRHWHYHCHCHCHGPWHCHWHWQGQGQRPKFEDKLSKKERVSFIRIWNTKAICHQQHYRLRTQTIIAIQPTLLNVKKQEW